MPVSYRIELEAVRAGSLPAAHGVLLNGAFYTRNRTTLLSELHIRYKNIKPFTISPIFDLTHFEESGRIAFTSGQACWFRVTGLDAFATSHIDIWINEILKQGFICLQERVTLDKREYFRDLKIEGDYVRTEWRVVNIVPDNGGYGMGAITDYEDFEKSLKDRYYPNYWKVHFVSPTTFHRGYCFNNLVSNPADVGLGGPAKPLRSSSFQNSPLTLPFPVPEYMIPSWLTSWNAFSTEKYALDSAEIAIKNLQIIDFDLVPKEMEIFNSKYLCFQGSVTIKQFGSLSGAIRRKLAVLFRYAFYCGTGFRTTQGFGQTLLEERVIKSMAQ